METEMMEKGVEIYRSYSERLRLPPDECIENLPGRLSSGWDVEDFLTLLGAGDAAALIEARKHFALPDFE